MPPKDKNVNPPKVEKGKEKTRGPKVRQMWLVTDEPIMELEYAAQAWTEEKAEETKYKKAVAVAKENVVKVMNKLDKTVYASETCNIDISTSTNAKIKTTKKKKKKNRRK